jgi:hypothetical protein
MNYVVPAGAPNPAPPAGERSDDEVVTEIRKAFVRWRFVQAEHQRLMPLAVVLADERFKALNVSRAQWGRVLVRLARTEGVHLWSESDQKRLTDDDRAAAVTLGGTERHVITYTAEYSLTSEGQMLIDAYREAASPPATEPRGQAAGEANWATRTAAELTELVDRARRVLTTGAGNDADQDAVRDQADVLAIIATLLPYWSDRGLHPDTEDNIERASDRLAHLVNELGG